MACLPSGNLRADTGLSIARTGGHQINLRRLSPHADWVRRDREQASLGPLNRKLHVVFEREFGVLTGHTFEITNDRIHQTHRRPRRGFEAGVIARDKPTDRTARLFGGAS